MTELTWGSTSDWDNADSEDEVTHSGSTLYPGKGTDNFDTYGVSTTSPGLWTSSLSGVITDQRSYSGDKSWEFASTISVNGDYLVLGYTELYESKLYTNATFRYYETGDNQSTAMQLKDETGSIVCFFGTNNPQVIVNDYTFANEILSSPSPEYEAWREMEITIDWSSAVYDVTWKDLTGNSSNVTSNNNGFWDTNATDISRIEIVADDRLFGNSGQVDTWIDDLTGISNNGSIITSEKVS